MMARALGLLVLGALGLLGLAALSVWAVQTVWPSYLAAWLAVAALPLGALTLMMARDLLAIPETPLAAMLRVLVTTTPLAALLAVPMLVWRERFFGLPDLRGNAFAAAWMAPPATLVRGIAILLAWVVLAVLFRRPPAVPGRRAALATLGLAVQLVAVTLAAVDWVGAVDRNLASSSLGLTLLVAQAAGALAVASLIAPDLRPAKRIPDGAASLMILFAAWLFLQFTQYLVVWSANLPAEAVWYLRRGGGLGAGGEIAAFVVMALGLAVFVPRFGRRLVPVFEALVALVVAFSMFWLVVPASRGEVSVHLADAAALVGFAGLLGGIVALLWRGGARNEGLAHGRA